MIKTLNLSRKRIVYIEPTSPFNFEGTFFKPSHFPSKLVYFSRGKLYQGIKLQNKFFGLVLSDSSIGNRPKIKVEIYSKSLITEKNLYSLKSELIERYNLDGNVSEFVKIYRRDRFLAGPIKRWGGTRPSSAYSLYGFLMVATVLQNATVRRSVQMLDNLLKEFGTKLKFASQELYVPWEPEDLQNVTEERLRELKVGYRAKNIKRITSDFVSGIVDEEKLRKLSNGEEVKSSLLQLYGVGPQSVSYILFEVFHFYGLLDQLSPWEGKIISQLLYGRKTVSINKILNAVDKRWGQWKALAIHYLFEDIFWQRKRKTIQWLEDEIRM